VALLNQRGSYQEVTQQYLACMGALEQVTGPYMQQTVSQKEKKSMLQELRDYMKKHRDLLFTFGLVLLLDQLVFKGAFRERLENVVKGMLGKVEQAAGAHNATDQQ
jgi:hypothetical protein